MRFLAASIAILASAATTVLAADVKVEVTRAVECERKSKKGDNISVHYRGNLQAEDGSVGKQFDASYDRGSPLDFVVGKGSVISGSVHNGIWVKELC
jgi:FK506-binding protein 2